jgi:ribulose-phosphate 3-epimerase
MKAVKIAPSILSANFANLAAELRVCEEGGADLIHIDVMDGCFVPNLTFGSKVISTVRGLTRLPLDVHLMVVEPEKYFDDFAAAGADIITIHAEAAPHMHRQIQRIQELGCRPGVAINPGTSLEVVREILPDLALLLVMTVNPGYGGQQYIASSTEKVARARSLLRETESSALLEVDGGINRSTIGSAWRAGADTFAAGNAEFGAADPAGEIAALRTMCGVFV